MSAILLLLAVIVFVLGALGVEVGDAGKFQLAFAGLALFAASFLVGPVLSFVDSRRGGA